MRAVPSNQEMKGLEDISKWGGGDYRWMPKTMEKLAARGFVETYSNRMGWKCHRLTEAGRQFLASFPPTNDKSRSTKVPA